MFENENESLEVESQTSESTESQSEESTEGKTSEAAQAAPKQENTPFHEHPRWIERDNELKAERAARQSLETKLAQLEARVNQPAPKAATQAEKDELIEDLKKIDPRLADRLEKATKGLSTIEQLQAKLEQYDKQSQQQAQSQVVQQAVAKINSMHEANKVSPEVKQILNDKFDLLYAHGKLTPQNLEAVYKESYESIKKYEDALKREALKSYVPAKKADANTPASQPKGTPAKPAAKKPTWSKDPETARAQIVERTLKQLRADKEADAV